MGMEIAVAPLLKAPLCGANNKGFNSKLPFTFYKTLSLLLLFVWSGYMSVKWTAPLAPFLSHTGADRVLISYILRRGKKRGWYYLSRSINTWKIRYWNDQVHVVPWKEGPRSVEREKIVLRGLFFQNPTASLYVSGKWGGWGGLSGASAPATPATSPTLAKFLRAHPFQLRRPGRPAKGSDFLAKKVGAVILPQGCERGRIKNFSCPELQRK